MKFSTAGLNKDLCTNIPQCKAINIALRLYSILQSVIWVCFLSPVEQP